MAKLKRTIKEQEFLKAYIELKGNATKAYLKCFPHVKLESASVLGANLLRKISIPIAELLDKMGITDHILNEKLQEGLDATTGIGDKKKPNYYVVAKYLDMIFRLKARYPIDETRLKLPGIGSGVTSVVLREVIYSKGEKKPKLEQIKRDITLEKVPF